MAFRILILCFLPNLLFAQTYLEEMHLKMENSRNYTLELLDLFTEEELDFKATEDVRSVREQFEHMQSNYIWLSSSHLTQKPYEGPKKFAGLSKAEIKAALEKSFAYTLEAIKNFDAKGLSEKVDFFAGAKTKRQIINLISDHLTHHRAQTIIYLRLLGKKPPRFRGW